MSSTTDILSFLAAQNPWWAPGGQSLSAPPRPRTIFDSVRRDLIDHENRRATLLLGPRQVGKSVLLRQIARDLLATGWPPRNLTLFNFDDSRIPGVSPWIDPAWIVEAMPRADPELPRILLLDEIHLALRWDRWLKNLVDRDRLEARSQLRVLATDSSASVLRGGTLESGQGRWNERRIYGLTFPEYLSFLAQEGESPQDVFQRAPQELERFLYKGGFPEHVGAEPGEDLWRKIREDIVERAIRRDLLARATAGGDPERLDVDRLRRLFVLLVQDSGAILNAEARGRDLPANRTTVTHWAQLFDDACLVHRLERFARSAIGHVPKAKVRSAPAKIYASEHGLIPALTLAAFPSAEAVVRSRVFEAVVLRHLLEVLGSRDGIFYYRDREDLEVDFVFRDESGLRALEVTSSRDPASAKVSRLASAASRIDATRPILVYGGALPVHKNEVDLVPLHHFLLDPRAVLAGEPS